MKIKKLKIKLNKDNEYSDYRYFMPKSNNIKMTDGRDVDEAVQSLKDKIANLKEQANYLINKAPLVKYAEGASIILTDCAEAPLRKLTIEGNSKQETRSGKNLLPQMVETTTTFQGRTYTSNGKGALSMTGVATGSGEVTFNLTKPILLGEENLYVHLLNNYATAGAGIRFLNGNTRLFEIIPTSKKIITDISTTYAGQTITAIQIYQNDSNSFDMTIQPMICTSNSSLEFEQYGASPSIEHESPIESVGNNINLLDTSNYIINNLPNVDVKRNNDGAIVINGTTNNYGGDVKIVYENPLILPAGNYSFIFGVNGAEKFNNELNITSLGKGTYQLVKRLTESLERKTIIFDTDFELYNYNIHFKPNTTFKDFVIYPKICKGISTPYSPYGQGSVEIVNCNKNLANYNDNRSDSNSNFDIGDVQKEKSYTLVLDIIGTISFNLRYSTSQNIVKTEYNRKGQVIISFNATETDKLIFNGFSGVEYTGMKIMLLEGIYTSENILEYVAHQSQTKALYTQQPFRAIGDVKDRFVKQSGVWYEEHKNLRYIFTGDEEIGIPNTSVGDGITPFRIRLPFDNKIHSEDYCAGLSNRLQIITNSNDWLNNLKNSKNIGVIVVYSNVYTALYLRIDSNVASTIEEFKEYLQANELYIDFPLATPTLIPCTAEQVEVLESLQSYDKITYYSVDKTNNVQANIKLIYKQDINAILEGEGV